MFGHFVGLALKGLIHLNPRNIRNEGGDTVAGSVTETLISTLTEVQ